MKSALRKTATSLAAASLLTVGMASPAAALGPSGTTSNWDESWEKCVSGAGLTGAIGGSLGGIPGSAGGMLLGITSGALISCDGKPSHQR